MDKPIVAIVGSRNCSDYGKKQAERFAKALSKKGVCIISGLARGVDSIAHYNSCNEEGKTIAVLACGINNIYPTENIQLAKNIIDSGGMILSEYEPDEEVLMSRFPKRNRIISGLADFVLVIEARYRSGSTITARTGMRQGKEVGCIPGDIDKKSSYGNNKLIQEGANLILSVQDILMFLGIDESERKIELEGKYKAVYEMIGTIPKSADEISRIVGLSVQEVNEILFMLEVDNFIQSLPGDKYVIKA